jgi:putative transposase
LQKLTYLQLDNIRAATSRGLVVGSDAFKDKIEQMIGQSVRPNPVGRPSEVRENSEIYFYL